MLTVNFQFGSGATAAAHPFGASVGQSSLGAAAQSSDAFSLPASVPETQTPFGAALPAPPAFGQGTSAAGGTALGGGTPTFGTAGTSAFRSTSTPAFTGSGPTFGPTSAPSFSIGSGSRTGGRQRLQARRQHARKK
ncbi:hypothetical protein JRQ81_008217 [Phrynocephalus forsythii]|uniref:Uncharacterized protein n=1 Tax=Phrynocephalus forsythii TaxID=171643 RepID=A0A9Q0XBG9_9SAUR|nr:hypothetical protein JRQ81_008217 [Phrynocephalus forsythii]